MSRSRLADAAQLVRRISAYNDIWHGLRDGDLGADVETTTVQRVARDAKSLLQVELLTQYPDLATLQVHLSPGATEPLYGVSLAQPLAGRKDACHLPVRLAEHYLPPEALPADSAAPPSHGLTSDAERSGPRLEESPDHA
jgi:hypothetical protein